MQRQRDAGRLNWVFNIIEGRAEQEDVLLRDAGIGAKDGEDERFLLTPDLNWDKKTITSLHLLALVERRDIWSLRDLKKAHVGWLKTMRGKVIEATVKLYEGIERDELKLYVHCVFPYICVGEYTPCGIGIDICGANRSTHILPFPHPRRACHG